MAMKYIEDRKGVWIPAKSEKPKKIIDQKRLSEVVNKLLAERRRSLSKEPITSDEVLEELNKSEP